MLGSVNISAALAFAGGIIAEQVNYDGQGVSLLYQNDGDWEHFESHPSALFFHDAADYFTAQKVCDSFGEQLLPCEDVVALSNQLQYHQCSCMKKRYWIADFQTTRDVSTPASCSNSKWTLQARTIDALEPLPFLCTNSAPLRKTIDVNPDDFPKNKVKAITSVGAAWIGTRDRLSFRFHGVPYAKPPLGKLRFADAERWEGEGAEVDATRCELSCWFKPSCLQLSPFSRPESGLNPWGTSEDCLYLNIYTPYLPGRFIRPQKPVIVWFHGGGNTDGSGSDATFDGGPLSSRADVVVVSVEYRLGAFGYLSWDKETLPGNYALSDKVTALQWIHDHIPNFGGDRDRVQIVGQSAGGWTIGELLTSPLAKGLFSSAVAQSGLMMRSGSIEMTKQYLAPVLEPLCPDASGVTRECLLNLDAEVLLNATAPFSHAFSYSVVDGKWLERPPIEQVMVNPPGVNQVPLLTGALPDEAQSFMASLNPNVTPEQEDFYGTLTATFGPQVAEAVKESGLWTPGDEFSVYNATLNVVGGIVITCPLEAFVKASSATKALPNIYVYSLTRAYGMPWFNPFGGCTFPTESSEPPPPYYRCHSGDLYDIFNTHHLFSQPARNQVDIYHTTLLQDIWGAFARSGGKDPLPDEEYLRSRGYDRTREALESVRTSGGWPTYGTSGQRMDLEWGRMSVVDGLVDEERCDVLLKVSSLLG
ncbi:Carboxylesterase family-domain-containing protein [Flagelloscypha sp. PMI_526]|nr:Carboxylesterase family-domain-containing protein [Flagelloscypha sp. PMI_526]